MTVKFDEYYQEIGLKALEYAEDRTGRLMIFAEVYDGAIACSILYVNKEGYVRLLFAPPPLRDLVYRFWEDWQKEPKHQEWREMVYLIDENGKFLVDFFYPEMVDPDKTSIDRRIEHVKKYIGDFPIDYTRTG